MDPVYGYQVTNVEAAMSSPSSLLHWTRRMIEIRKQNRAFGLGSYTELPSTNPAVLAFLREAPPGPDGEEDDLVLCVHNFSRFAQPTELDLQTFAGRHPVELTGGVRFPAIGDLPYLLTLVEATASTGSACARRRRSPPSPPDGGREAPSVRCGTVTALPHRARVTASSARSTPVTGTGEHLPRPRPEHQARPSTLPEPRTVRGTSPPRTPASCGR